MINPLYLTGTIRKNGDLILINPKYTRQYGQDWWSMLLLLFLTACTPAPQPAAAALTLPAEVYLDKVHGAWQATLVANHTGLPHEGQYLAEPSPATAIELVLPPQWSTDDDTAVEWVDLHILETDGLEPTYAQIRAQWLR